MTRADFDALAADVATVSARVAALEATDGQQNSDIAALQSVDATQSTDIASLQTEVGQLDTRVTRIESKLPPHKPGCGLGVELALVMPLLGLATSRRRRVAI